MASSGPAPDSSRSVPIDGFRGLDELACGGHGGVAIIHAPTREVADAAIAHVLRRARAMGRRAEVVPDGSPTPFWREVASRLGIVKLPGDPSRAAEAIASAALSQRAVLIGSHPPRGSWDLAVATELSLATAAPLVLLVAPLGEATEPLRARRFEVRAELDSEERRRWWSGLADEVPLEGLDSLPAMDAWLSHVCADSSPDADVSPPARRLLKVLGLVGRAWPVAAVSALEGDEHSLAELVRARRVRVASGAIIIQSGHPRAAHGGAPPALVELAAAALSARHPGEPWAQQRAAELLLTLGEWDAADAAHARALVAAEDWLVRREIVSRWRDAVGVLPEDRRASLCLSAAERALAAGDAEDASAWARSALTLAGNETRVALVMGRAALALGDLVASKAALELGAKNAADDAARGTFAAELAEVAYLAGDASGTAEQANIALSLNPAPEVRLSVRNTLGKVLLARSAWDAADRHFAEDVVMAAEAGLCTAELRARSNRGIALLSKGLVAEAGAMFEAVLSEGQRVSDARACAFAFDNLLCLAMMRHEYAEAMDIAEKALAMRRRLGDRVAAARLHGNLAELRRQLGLYDHAEHAVAFGRRALAPGMPPGRSAFLSLQAARNALARGDTLEASREASRALVESEASGTQGYVAEALLVAARVGIEDGDVARSRELLDRARALSDTDERRAETALLTAKAARANGADTAADAVEALRLARTSGKEDLILEAHRLVADIRRSAGRTDLARAEIEEAMTLRDQVASRLPAALRAGFLARKDVRDLATIHASLAESSSDDEAPPSSTNARGAPKGSPIRRVIAGDDPAIRALLAAIKRVARSNATVLIRGESGTGKELVAEAIHRASERGEGPLVTVNCAALVETLLLSELFGHEKGAFTGATARRRGRFELAERGTLFLDEIGDISARTQVALLRVLQERCFERVGGTAVIRADVRVICATHRDLRSMVEKGEFREDLYYRLRGVTLSVPPLRARLGDMPTLAAHLLGRIASERSEEAKTLTGDALDLLRRHRWPGNVRELENVLRAASLFAEGPAITAQALLESAIDLDVTRPREPFREPASDPPLRDGSFAAPAATRSLLEVVSAEDPATAAYSQVRAGSTSLPMMKRQIERACVARALAETKGNIARAATLLGMKRPRLSQLVGEYGLASVASEDS